MNQLRHQYLSDVETRLRRLPDVDREQEMAEITQHLDALIAARQSEGQVENAATKAAIAQFGTAREIGGALTQTGAYQRFAPFWETVLFCAPVFALLYTVSFLLTNGQDVLRWRWLTDSYSSEPVADVARSLFARYGMTLISWIAGGSACALLISRYGRRGALRKALHPALAHSGGVRWLILTFLIARFVPYLVSCAFVVPQEFSLLNAHGSARLFYWFVWLAAMWISAYCVGRNNKARGSAANAMAAAASLNDFYTVAFLLMQFALGNRGYIPHLAHKPLSMQLYSFAVWFGVMLVGAAIDIFTVRFFAQWGEKSRTLSRAARQIAQ